MKTVIRNSDHLAVYAGDDLTLTAEGVRGPGWIDPSLTTDTATLLDLTLPEGFIPGAYAYVGGAWVVADQEIVDTHNAELVTQVVEHVLSEGYTLGKVSA